jgi:hypothetical protein
MLNNIKRYVPAIPIFALLYVPPVSAATEWLPYQETLKPQAARSLYKPSLSPSIKISKPDNSLPEDIVFFSGIWGGGICNGFSNVIIAVTEITAKKASVVYSLGNYTGAFDNQEYEASFIDGELVGRTKTGFEIILGKRISDGHLNIKWLRGDDTQQTSDTTPDICYEVLEREI